MRAGLLLLASTLAVSAFGQNLLLDCGAPVDGAFAQPAGDTYTFQAHIGDAVTIRLLATSPTTDRITFGLKSASHVIAPRSTAISTGATLVRDFDLLYEGVYQITVSDLNPTPTTAYKLVFTFLNRPCGSAAIACGVGRQDQIKSALQVNSYQFQPMPGDVLSLRFGRIAPFITVPATATSPAISFTPVVIVYGPTGQVMTTRSGQSIVSAAPSSGNLRIDFPAPSTGPLTIVVFDPTTLAGNYALSIATLNRPCGTGALDCGKILQSNISAPLATDSYSLAMLAGDVGSIRIASLSTGASFIPSAELYDPSGAALSLTAATLPASRAVLTYNFNIKLSGAYTLLVHDGATGTASGGYTLTMARFNRPCNAETLSCSSLVDGAITGVLGSKMYTVSASANDVFLVRLLNHPSGAFRPRVDVYDPQANSVTSMLVNDLGRRTFTATADGVYTLIVSDGADASQSGAYRLALQRLNRPCNTAPLTCGALATGSLAQPLSSVTYTYAAARGESFTLRMLDPTGVLQPGLEIYDPQGALVGQNISGNFAGVDVAQPAGGAYTILALDNSSRPAGGPFGIALLRTVNACAASAPRGQTVTAIASAAAPFASYTMGAAAGDQLLLRSASSTAGFAAQMELYDPTGARVDAQTFSLSRKAALAGNYTAIIGPSAPHSAGGYSFAWQILNNPAGAAALVCGGSVAGSLAPGNAFRFYTATAARGDLLRLLLTKVSDNFSPRVDLYDPTGAFVVSNADIAQKAQLDGNYLVLVSPSTSNGGAGAYTLAFQRPNNPCSPALLTCGQTTLHQVVLPGQLDTFAFTGAAGDRANLKLAQRSGGYTPFAELYDPSGARVGSSSSGSMIANLPASGPYSLLVRDSRATTLGSYRVTLQNDTSVCKVDDTQAPSVVLLQPTGGEVIGGGTAYLVQWLSDDNVGVATHDIALSTDGGKTFGSVIATGLSGNAQSYTWQAPPDIAPTRSAVFRLTATDAAGNAGVAMSGPLTIIGAGFTPNSTVTYSYDPLNRMIAAALSDGRTVSYTWDADGNLIGISISR